MFKSCSVQKWFEQYQGEIERLNISSPEQIWNCDETRCQDVPKEWEVVGETGVEAYTIVSKEQGETTTVLNFANAVGKICPPVIIHKESRVQYTWCLDAPVGVMVRASVNGWINREIFLEYATRWLRWMHSWKPLDKPHLLLLEQMMFKCQGLQVPCIQHKVPKAHERIQHCSFSYTFSHKP